MDNQAWGGIGGQPSQRLHFQNRPGQARPWPPRAPTAVEPDQAAGGGRGYLRCSGPRRQGGLQAVQRHRQVDSVPGGLSQQVAAVSERRLTCSLVGKNLLGWLAVVARGTCVFVWKSSHVHIPIRQIQIYEHTTWQNENPN